MFVASEIIVETGKKIRFNSMCVISYRVVNIANELHFWNM